MQEAKKEHQVTNIQFAMVETFPMSTSAATTTGNNNKNGSSSYSTPKLVAGGGIRRKPLNMEQTMFAMPSVTISRNQKLARQRKANARRRSTMAWTLRVFILIFPVIYYKQISGFLLEVVPQTVLSTGRIHGDYSSIGGIHDLSTSNVKPWCWVSEFHLLRLEVVVNLCS